MRVRIHHPALAFDSYRAACVQSLFNVEGIGFDLEADLPIDGPDAAQWQIGLVVGPSGSGKSSLGARIWGKDALRGAERWPKDSPIIDAIAPDLPDGNGRFPEEAARRSGASAELLRLLAAPPAANGRRARTVRPNGTNRHPRRPDPRPRFSTAAQRSNPEILQRNGSVSGKNRIRNRFVLSGLRENTAQRAAKP